MKIDLDQLYPWADIDRMFGNMRSLHVTVGGDELSREADISIAEDGALTIAFDAKPAPKRATRATAARGKTEDKA